MMNAPVFDRQLREFLWTNYRGKEFTSSEIFPYIKHFRDAPSSSRVLGLKFRSGGYRKVRKVRDCTVGTNLWVWRC